ncbi:hypothetical protein JCM6882_008436, partial [Rhodosporidiobolus microsporus]
GLGFSSPWPSPPPTPPPPPPLRAHSLILLSPLPAPAADGFDYRVLLLKRHAQSRTYDSAHVFPGGNLDPVDSSPSLHAFLPAPFSFPSPSSPSPASARDPALLRTLTLTALRETFEESGLLLLSPSASSAEAQRAWAQKSAEERRGWRERVSGDGGEMVGLLEELEKEGEGGRVRLAGEGVREWARWITPEGLPRRYDTTFFLTLLPSFAPSPSPSSSATSSSSAHLLALSDGTETTLAEWLTPGEAIQRALRYTRLLKAKARKVEPPSSEGEGGPSAGEDDDEGILLHPPQFQLLAELAHNHPSYLSLLAPPSQDFSSSSSSSSSSSTAYPPCPYPTIVRPRAVPTFLPRAAKVLDDSGRGRRAMLLPGDGEYDGAVSGSGAGGPGGKRRNRTFVLPPEKGKAGLVVEGVLRAGMVDVLGEGWEDVRAGDYGGGGGDVSSPPLPPGRAKL